MWKREQATDKAGRVRHDLVAECSWRPVWAACIPERERASLFPRYMRGACGKGCQQFRPRKIDPAKAVEKWNVKVSVGDTVEYREYPEAEPQKRTTRTPAEVLSGHTAVVWLNGIRGCVCVAACRPVGLSA